MKPSFSRVIPKGSVLVFSLIILSVMLVTALTLLSSAVFQEKSALSTGDSAHSFQVADSGVEQVLYQLYQKSPDTIATLAGNLGLSCTDGTVADANAGWTVRFYDVDGNRLTVCASKSEDVASIKSEGTSQGTTRAVQVAVAAGGSQIEIVEGTKPNCAAGKEVFSRHWTTSSCSSSGNTCGLYQGWAGAPPMCESCVDWEKCHMCQSDDWDKVACI